MTEVVGAVEAERGWEMRPWENRVAANGENGAAVASHSKYIALYNMSWARIKSWYDR